MQDIFYYAQKLKDANAQQDATAQATTAPTYEPKKCGCLAKKLNGEKIETLARFLEIFVAVLGIIYFLKKLS